MHNKKKGNPATNDVSTALTLETLFEIFSPKCVIPGKVSKLEQKAAEGSVNPQFQSGSECDSFWQSSHWTTSILPLSLNDAEQGFTKRGNYLKEQMRVMRFLSHEIRWDCGAIMARVYWSCSQTTTDPHNITNPLTNILSPSKESTLTCWWTITLSTRPANKLIAKDKKSQIHSPTICCVDENFNIHIHVNMYMCVYT